MNAPYHSLVSNFHSVNLMERIKAASTVIIFGSGSGGRYTASVLRERGVNVDYFCDNASNTWGHRVNGIEVISPATLSKYQNGSIVLIASNWAGDIAAELRKLDISEFYDLTCWDDRWEKNYNPALIRSSAEKIEQVHSYFEDERSRELYLSLIKYRLDANPLHICKTPYRWYAHPEVSAKSGDMVFDVGAFDGKTTLEFAAQVGTHGRVVAFEPDPANFKQTRDALTSDSLGSICEVRNTGFWSSITDLSFVTDQHTASQNRIAEDGDQTVSLVTIDSFVETETLVPDLIKMDIEGAELQAIIGGTKTLQYHRPKLQICLYHEPDDMWSIPLEIKGINPQYRFFLGHHSQNLFETVLYAI